MQIIKKILYTFLVLILILGCSSESEKSEQTVEEVTTDQEIATEETLEEAEKNTKEEIKLTVVVSDNKDKLRSYYDIPWIKEFYEYQMEMAYEEPGNYEVP